MSTCPEYEHFSEFYDEVTAYRERGDVAFFVDLARQADGPVLEAGCGTGRVLIPTARAGIAIDGLDSAPAMLNICRASLDREPPEVRARVRLHHGDMRAPALNGPYALITLPFRSFLHVLTVEDQLRTLSALHALLVPGGRLVLDIFNPSLPYLTDPRAITEPIVEPDTALPDGRRLLRTYRVVSRDHITQTQLVEFGFRITEPDGRWHEQRDTFALRYIFRYEAEHLLERAGFRVEALYAGYDRQPYGSTYPGELVFVARRP